MNSSSTSSVGEPTSPECEVYVLLGGKLDRPTSGAYAFLVFITVAGVITCPLTVALNLLVVIAVLSKPRLKSISNITLVCLATTDCLVGLIRPLVIAMKVSLLQAEAASANCMLQR